MLVKDLILVGQVQEPLMSLCSLGWKENDREDTKRRVERQWSWSKCCVAAKRALYIPCKLAAATVLLYSDISTFKHRHKHIIVGKYSISNSSSNAASAVAAVEVKLERAM
ncbi:hypothetical protein PV325_004205 [Microctonus aethiopoides]|nr:hypothetical protein PV325_004205 [Microctonus aethiopoides]